MFNTIHDSISVPRVDPALRHQQVTVLLVDRHPSFRRGVSETLQASRAGTTVFETDDGEEALGMVEQLSPQVVFCETSARNVSGLELVRRLAQSPRQPRTIILSSLNEPAFVRLFLDAGACGYVSKAATKEQLLDAFSTVLRGKRYLEPEMDRSHRASRNGAQGASPQLSAREEQVLRLLSCGGSMREVGEALQVSERTVETYRLRAVNKLGLTSRADLVRFAILQGWLESLR